MALLAIYLIGNHHSCLLYPFKVCESIYIQHEAA